MKIRENKGITLIALVITIIVLLILAGVSIASLSGENGLLSKSTKAKQETIKAEMKEQLGLALQDLQIERRTQGQIPTLRDINQEWMDTKLGGEYPDSKIYDTITPNAIYIQMTKDTIIGNFKIDEKLNIVEESFDSIAINVEPEFVEDDVFIKVSVRALTSEIKKIELLDENNTLITETAGENKEEQEVRYQIEFGKSYKIKVTTNRKTKEAIVEKIDEKWNKINIPDEFYKNISITNAKTEVRYNSSFEAEISGKTGCVLTSLAVNGKAVTITDGKGKISIANVTEDIEITGTVEKIKFTVTTNLDSHLTTDNTQTVIEYGEAYNATITPKTGYCIKALSVTMGGNDVSKDVVSDVSSIKIKSVTGNIVITGASKELEDPEVFAFEGHDLNSVQISVVDPNLAAGTTYDYYVNGVLKQAGSSSNTYFCKDVGSSDPVYPVKAVIHYGNSSPVEVTTYAGPYFYAILTDKGVYNLLDGTTGFSFNASQDYTAQDGLGIGAYDGNFGTAAGIVKSRTTSKYGGNEFNYNMPWEKYILVHPSARGKKIQIRTWEEYGSEKFNLYSVSVDSFWNAPVESWTRKNITPTGQSSGVHYSPKYEFVVEKDCEVLVFAGSNTNAAWVGVCEIQVIE